jgi:mono/diheme cytochrome c family protein
MKRYLNLQTFIGGVASMVLTLACGAGLALLAAPTKASDRQLTAVAKSPARTAPDQSSIDRGRYLVKIGGCNDCHTPGFTQSNGQVDEQKWLTGDGLGWQGPWGTTFAINLRSYVGAMTEEQWVVVTRNSKARPPMPVWVFKDMTEQDLRATYRFIRSLGTAGKEAPTYVPPGQTTSLPVVKFPR